LVFGQFGLPRMGMRGSALATLAAVSVMFAGYLICLPRGFFDRLLRCAGQGRAVIARQLWLRLRRGAPSGGTAGLDETAQTVFVWFAGALGVVALGADNAVLALNYVAVIPLLGLGTGCGVLCGNAVGSKRWSSVWTIVRVTLVVEGLYVTAICLLQVLIPAVLLAPFGLNHAGSLTVASAIDTAHVVWTYAAAFMFSVVATAALECLGLARFAFLTRIVVTWAIAIPLICLITLAHRGNSGFLPVIWVIFALAEAVIAVLCFRRLHLAAATQENQLIAAPDVAEPVYQNQ
jgi:multidrug resistance protein, MATE family